MRIGRARRGLGMVLHAECGDVQKRHALHSAVVEVDVGQPNAPEALVPHNGSDAGAYPKAQVIVMFGIPAR